MTFFIPPIKDVVQRARNAFRAEMPGTDAFVWPNNIYVSAKVIGGAVWEVFGRLKWMDRQRFAMTASGYELERHGLDYGIGRKASSFAQGNIIFVATAWPTTIPSGTVFTRDDGTTYTSTLPRSVDKYTLSASVPVVANASGKNGNTVYGTPMSASITGFASAAVDDVGLGQGADQETDDQLRKRILLRKRYPPRGGALYDYVQWALSLPGVTRVFPVANAYGRGTVGVWFLMDDTYLAGIPLQADVDAVQAYIDSQAPMTANVIVQAPTADCIDITVKGLKPDTQANRERIAAEMQSVFRNMTQPGVPGGPFTLYHLWLEKAITGATAEVVAPATDLTFGAGIMPCIKSVTFIP